MRTVVVRNGARILLGKQGENKAVRVVWSGIVEQYARLYGDGRFELVVVQKGQAYPAVVSVDGDNLIWDVLATDVATMGAGSLELIYYVGDTIAKSQTWETFVVASKSAEGTTEPPDPAKNWVDTVLKSSSDAKQSATESAESARQSAESSSNAQKYAENAAESANEAQKSREAIENMEVSAVGLSPDSDATVEKSIVDDKVKLTFGIPKGEKGENDIFWLNTSSSYRIAETFDEILAAYKAGKNIWIRDTQSFPGGVATAPAFLVRPIYDDNGNNINGMVIVCGGSALASAEIDAGDVIINATYYIIYDPSDLSAAVYFYLNISRCAELGDSVTPIESQFNGSAGRSTAASPVDHIHPAPFPDWTNNIGKALFVNNANEMPSQAFEWRDVPNGDFTSKVGDFLKVAEIDSNNKPTKWTTDSISGTKEPMVVTFTVTNIYPFEFRADTLYYDIKEAANAGRIVYAFIPSPGPVFGQLTNASSSILQFNAFGNVGQMMNITMNSDSDITGVFIDSLYRLSDNSGGGDFDADDHRIMNVSEPTDPSDVATKWYVDKTLTADNSDSIVIKSSTPNSTKKFRITVDDAGAISATEI